MLLSFSIENYASIGKKQTINLKSGKARGKNDHLINYYNKNALKFSSIYGANASGKTTIIKAMHFGKIIIKNGDFDKRNMKPNKSNIAWYDKPTMFLYEIFISNKIYEYSFYISWKTQKIIKEQLIEKNSRGKVNEIFIRDFILNKFNLSLTYKNKEQENRMQMYFSDSSKEENSLFLHDINYGKGGLFTDYPSLKFLKDIYNWFINKLKFVYPNNSGDLGKYNILRNLDENENLYDYIKLLDLPISNITYSEISKEAAFKDFKYELIQEIEEDLIKRHQQLEKENNANISLIMRSDDDYLIIEANSEGFQKIKTVEFTHGEYGRYDFNEESDGTKRMLELLEIITSPEEDVTYVIDEIDRSLHPLLTEQFILMYLHPDIANKKQLIITTHESRLLNLNNLRKDEIYFTDNKNGESRFTRLDEYESSDARTDINIELPYLNGRYTGIPHVINPECN